MILVMKPDASQAEIDNVIERLEKLGLSTHLSRGKDRTIIGAVGDVTILRDKPLESWGGVEKVLPVMKPFKLASRDFHPQDSTIRVGERVIGGEDFHVIAGPCSVEGREMTLEVAHAVKEAGATFLRGGAFKPRTSPYSFQGLEEEGLRYLAEAREETGLLVVTELMDPRDLPLVREYADVIQMGARNMQNFRLLREVGGQEKPVLLKRGPSATLVDLLLSAEYILHQGNSRVILCERGIRTFETHTRYTLDLSAVPALKELTHLPVIVDPSHGVGLWNLVSPMAKAAAVVGAHGAMVEVHNRPAEALSDGPQSLKPERFRELMAELKRITDAVGKKLPGYEEARARL
ncbi:MAG: 3-deoxy-7-phosphoheptulonate synthase [Nitrospinota bacterium]